MGRFKLNTGTHRQISHIAAVDGMFQLHITSSQATGSDRPSQVGAAARRRVWTSHGPGVVFLDGK